MGLGKIGLPLAVQFAAKGHHVYGADVSQRTVDLVNSRIEPFPGEAHLAEKLDQVVSRGLLTAMTSTADAVAESQVVVVVVPLVVDAMGHPDFRAMDQATRAVGQGLTSGTLVSYETTLPIGTTRTRYGPMLQEESGLITGEEFNLVHSPERVLTGRVFADLRRYPKLVGGFSKDCEQRAVDFYSAVLDFDPRPDLPRPNGVWAMGSAEAAEMAKLAETTYRDVNIGLANQFARFADSLGIDVYALINACNSQPYSHIHRPGIAVGGHCIPVYPRLYLNSDPDASIVDAARRANAAMPEYAIELLASEYGDLRGARVVVLGASYRGGVKETAFSGVFPVVAALRGAGARVAVHDPMFTDEELTALGWPPHRLGDPIDAAVIQADHKEYLSLRPSDLPGVKVVLDGRGMLDRESWKPVRLVQLGARSPRATT